MITYTAKKIFNGHVSIRDYIVKKAIRENNAIQVYFEGEFMVLELHRLKHAVSTFHAKEFVSAFNKNKKYKLYDFVWRPNPPEKEFKTKEIKKVKESQLSIF